MEEEHWETGRAEDRHVPRPPRWYQTAATVFTTTVLLFAAVNLAVWLALTLHSALSPEQRNPVAQRHRKPVDPLYPDMKPAEVDELLFHTWHRSFQYESFTQFKEGPYSSRYVNVSPFGFRITRNQGPWPPRRDLHRTIFLFGGSTTFCYGLPDDQTIASHLQDMLAADGVDARVYNFGRGYYFSSQERALFEKLLTAKTIPDVAIFIDGINEFFYRNEEPVFTRMLQDCGKRSFRKEAWRKALLLLPVGKFFQPKAPPIHHRGPDLSAEDGAEPPDDPQMIEHIVERYATNKRIIEGVAAAFGVKTVFVWQPTPVYKYDLTYHRFAEGGFGSHGRGRSGYALVDRRAREGVFGDNFVWCADIQEGKKEPLYVDLTHYSSALARELAACISRALKARGLP
ncbi:MAG: hypothetical protein LDL33_06250 [Desulfomonile sp.]|nr:hypothetical protein [Desulfomonile sp.]